MLGTCKQPNTKKNPISQEYGDLDFYTTTNATPHKRLFSYQWQTLSEHSLPTWFSTLSAVVLYHQVDTSKYKPLADEVYLLEANPQYVHVRFTDEHESMLSVRDLAPVGYLSQSE